MHGSDLSQADLEMHRNPAVLKCACRRVHLMDQGNTTFILISAALVLLMAPGLAFFYGGLVKAKSVISMMMMTFGAAGLIGVLWVLYGYAIAFPGSDGLVAPWAIDWSAIGLESLLEVPEGAAYPPLAFVAFQATFAIITVALISGAIADRAKFGSWMLFAGVWATVVYFPVASWVFNFGLADDGSFAYGGWITYGLQETFGVGVIDFAGGTAVHINAGAAALALALVVGRRVGFRKGAHVPHNPPFVLLGAGLLWFGWFGFNGGSELAADGTAALVYVNTIAATAAALLAWLVVEKVKDGKPTSVGAASGAVAGLVAITPACAALDPVWAIVLGAVAGSLCALAIELKFKLGFDDSLDVVGIHLVGGLIGTLYLGFFANGTGLFMGGDGTQLIVQAIAAFSVLAYSLVLTLVIGFAIEKTLGFRVKSEDEIAGVDLAEHGEEGYVLEEKLA